MESTDGLEPAQAAVEEEALPVASLLPASEVSKPDVQTWKFVDLEEDEVRKENELRSEVAADLRREIKPEVLRESNLIKKNAYEKAQKEGYDAGYAEGLVIGKKEAFAKAEKEADETLNEQVASLQNLLDSMGEPYHEVSQSVFKSLSQLAISIANQVISVEMESHQDWILKVIEEAIDQLPDESQSLDIELNPDDCKIVEKYLTSQKKSWKLISSSKITKGACRVKQNNSVVVNDWQERIVEFMNETHSAAQQVALEAKQTSSSEPSQAADNSSQSSST